MAQIHLIKNNRSVHQSYIVGAPRVIVNGFDVFVASGWEGDNADPDSVTYDAVPEHLVGRFNFPFSSEPINPFKHGDCVQTSDGKLFVFDEYCEDEHTICFVMDKHGKGYEFKVSELAKA